MQIYKPNNLISVNLSAKNSRELRAFAKDISDKVEQKFGIKLHQEPENLEN
jgi:UDP-N-acetylenolpyruvoylglucosamine reductase